MVDGSSQVDPNQFLPKGYYCGEIYGGLMMVNDEWMANPWWLMDG